MKIQKRLFVALVVSCATFTIDTQANIDWDATDDELTEFFINESYEPDLVRSSDDAADIAALAEDIGFTRVLQNVRLYQRTNPVVQRSPHDIPIIADGWRGVKPCSAGFWTTGFYHENSDTVLSPQGSPLPNYINLRSREYLDNFDVEAISNLVDNLSPFEILSMLNVLNDSLKDKFKDVIALDIPGSLGLLEEMEHQVRQAGGMLNARFQTLNGTLHCALPLFYVESNFFLETQDKERILKSELFTRVNKLFSGEATVPESFLERHLVNDFFGLGDLRTTFTLDMFTTPRTTLSSSLELILPTHTVIHNRELGIDHVEKPRQPDFDIFDYIQKLRTDQLDKQAALDEVTRFGVGALDRLARIAGDVSLGRESVTAGWVLFHTYQFDERTQLAHEFHLDYGFPAHAIRFFRRFVGSEFHRSYDTQEDLNFLSQRLVDELYPPAKEVRVSPGITVQYTPSLIYQTDDWYTRVGYDVWHQARETIDELPNEPIYKDFDVERARTLSATQHKLFAQLHHTRERCNHMLDFGLGVDVTVSGKNIGKDWNVSGTFGFHF